MSQLTLQQLNPAWDMSSQCNNCQNQVQSSQEDPCLHDLVHGLWPSYCCWTESWPSFLYSIFPALFFDFFTVHIIDIFWEVNRAIVPRFVGSSFGFWFTLSSPWYQRLDQRIPNEIGSVDVVEVIR